jgi:hypothetical protein
MFPPSPHEASQYPTSERPVPIQVRAADTKET